MNFIGRNEVNVSGAPRKYEYHKGGGDKHTIMIFVGVERDAE